MENLYDLFLSLDYKGVSPLFIKILVLFLLSCIIIFVLFLIFSKFIYLKNKKIKGKAKFHSDYRLPFTLLWSLIVFIIVFSIYFGILIKVNGIDNIPWDNYRLYIGFFKPKTILPIELIYIGTIIYFIIINFKFRKSINQK